MRKTNNILLMLFLASIGFGLYSCSDDLVKSDYDYKQNPAAGLATVQINTLEMFTDESITLSATISSLGDSPIYDQGFIYSTDNSFATFTTISVTPEKDNPTQLKDTMNLAQGKDFFFKAFVMTKDGLATSSEFKTINLTVTWEKVGTVSLTDNTFTGNTYDVELQKFRGRNEYRLIDPFNPSHEGDTQYLRFFLDDGANAINGIANGLQPINNTYSFYWHSDYVGPYCSFTNKANVYTLNFIIFRIADEALLTGGNIIFEWVDGYPGEIPEPIEPIEVSYKTDFSNAAGQAGWVLDRFSGSGEDDLVFFFNMKDAGAEALGYAIAAYHETEPLQIISPSITVAPNDTLSFGLYSGVFGSNVNAKVKVYIREDGGELDLNNPVKNWDLPKGGGSTAIPLETYEGKSIKVIYVVEQGDFLFYRFAVAPSTDQSRIFQ